MSPNGLEAVERTLDDFVCKTGVNFELNDTPTDLGCWLHQFGWAKHDGRCGLFLHVRQSFVSWHSGYCNTCDEVELHSGGDVTFYALVKSLTLCSTRILITTTARAICQQASQVCVRVDA